MPVAIKQVFLSNEICQALISLRQAVVVPQKVDDVAEPLTWILWEGPKPLGCSYPAIIINLYNICTFYDNSINI
jgi:hypothetical protein